MASKDERRAELEAMLRDYEGMQKLSDIHQLRCPQHDHKAKRGTLFDSIVDDILAAEFRDLGS